MAITPGPWVAERTCSGKSPDAGCAVIASNDPGEISNPSRGIVAWATRHVGQTSAEVEANARLIAASPDMLAALKAVRREMRREHDAGDGHFSTEQVEAVEASIRKAEGKG